MKISIAVCTHNEGQYVDSLLTRLINFIKGPGTISGHAYEIVVVDDNSNHFRTLQILARFSERYEYIKVYNHKLDGDFASHKNFMNSKCTGDWIINLDADEWLPEDVLFNIPAIIESNPEVEAYWFPRINTVDGLTQAHVTKWFWTLSRLDDMRVATNRENLSDAEIELLRGHDLIITDVDGIFVYDIPIICWPDPQMRLYKNSPDIKWVNKVHERLVGFKNFSNLPYTPDYAIRHEKDIRRQTSQNEFYETLNKIHN